MPVCWNPWFSCNSSYFITI